MRSAATECTVPVPFTRGKRAAGRGSRRAIGIIARKAGWYIPGAERPAAGMGADPVADTPAQADILRVACCPRRACHRVARGLID